MIEGRVYILKMFCSFLLLGLHSLRGIKNLISCQSYWNNIGIQYLYLLFKRYDNSHVLSQYYTKPNMWNQTIITQLNRSGL